MLADARAAGKTDAAPFTVSGIRAQDMAVRLKYADLPVGPVIPDREEAIRAALEATPPGETLYVLPTYTAMLEIRKTLSEHGLHAPVLGGQVSYQLSALSDQQEPPPNVLAEEGRNLRWKHRDAHVRDAPRQTQLIAEGR